MGDQTIQILMLVVLATALVALTVFLVLKRPFRHSWILALWGTYLLLYGVGYIASQILLHVNPVAWRAIVHASVPYWSLPFVDVAIIVLALILIISAAVRRMSSAGFSRWVEPDKADVFFVIGVIVGIASLLMGYFWR
jgi:hypothetical protein